MQSSSFLQLYIYAILINSVKKQINKRKKFPIYSFSYGRKTFRFILDKVVIFRLVRQLHGRFWGVAGLGFMFGGLLLCCLINPDMVAWSTAFSDFGRDVKTAPYLAASLFLGAYGLWRWRQYLRRTLKHSRPVTALVGLTVTGLYIAALMPIAWEPWPYRLHVFGVVLSGVSMAAVVVVDSLLTRQKKNQYSVSWRMLRLLSFILIIVGGYITLGSAAFLGWYELALVGELAMFAGYFIWVADKTYRGEGARSNFSKLLGKVVLID
jgi:multisubunit Na+/H+ antiporter MnhG subunit